jgi:hypothetical protein
MFAIIIPMISKISLQDPITIPAGDNHIIAQALIRFCGVFNAIDFVLFDILSLIR